MENKIYTEERVNYDKRISQQNSVNQDLQITKKSPNYTLCVKLHTECKSTLGLGKNEKYKFVKLHTLCKTTPSVQVHLVCGGIENTQKLHKVCQITHPV